ncbi:ABC transporter permease [Solibacillus sp. FSL R5-0449]|uniref:YhgE/Pip domain-containing protein n=1 Tax=Solibacillus sp. FSL R5-0449 TaxID=2921639 RepID=UPI0030D1DAD3
MLKNKLVLALPFITLAIIFIFSLTLYPNVQPKVRDLPIAIVNEDEGVTLPNGTTMNMGQTIVDMIENGSSDLEASEMIKWVFVESDEAVQKGLDAQKYYGALVIPNNFSEKQVSLQTPAPTNPAVQIYINQGMHMQVSTIAGQVLNGVVDNMNNAVRTQLIESAEKNGELVSAQLAGNLVTPIQKNVINVNEVSKNTANGNAPFLMLQPMWLASLVGAAILFFTASKLKHVSRKESFATKGLQLLMAFIAAIFIGFGFTWIAGDIVGLNIPSFMDTALFLSITSISFILLILALFSWIGFRAMPIFVLLLFFGAPLFGLAPEMMSVFYRDWLYPLLPMRFMVEGLRELFFFNAELSWDLVATQVWMIGVSCVVIILSVWKKSKDKQEEIVAEQVEA